ncbi:MAG: AI-2E family transporter [Patescibacteria group bacterium]|nr:AI-2E family transporter [Patescibacteria group bacterium]
MSNLTKNELSISTASIVKIAIFFLLFYFLYLASNIVLVLFISFILFAAFNPIVNKMQSYNIPRPAGVAIIYLFLFIIIISVFILLVPIIISQVGDLIKIFPHYLDKAFANFSQLEEYYNKYGIKENVQNNLDVLSAGIGGGIKGIVSIIAGIFGGFASFFIILVISFYMLIEKSFINNMAQNIIPLKYRKDFVKLSNKIKDKLGDWARAQMLLSLIIFVLTFTALSIFKIKYALVLALIAGLTEFIPYLGPIIGAIPAVFLALFQSPVSALIVIIIYVVIQQFENMVLVPQIMQKVVGINPIISIVALMAGFKVGGMFGAILAIPLAILIIVVLSFLPKTDKKRV